MSRVSPASGDRSPRFDHALSQALDARGLGSAIPARFRGSYAELFPRCRPIPGIGLNRFSPSYAVPVAVADALEERGALIGRDRGKTSVLHFADVLVSVRRVGARAEVRIVKRSSPGDAGLDLAGLAGMAGDRWLDDGELAAMRAPVPVDAILAGRMADVLTAMPSGTVRSVEYHAPVEMGGIGSARVGMDCDRRWVRTLARRSAEHAASVADPAYRWELPRGSSRHTQRLASSWRRAAVERRARAPEPETSVILRLARSRAAARRMASWLAETGAPVELVSAARFLATR